MKDENQRWVCLPWAVGVVGVKRIVDRQPGGGPGDQVGTVVSAVEGSQRQSLVRRKGLIKVRT